MKRQQPNFYDLTSAKAAIDILSVATSELVLESPSLFTFVNHAREHIDCWMSVYLAAPDKHRISWYVALYRRLTRR